MAYSFPADVRMKMVGITTAVIADVSSTAVNLTDLIAEADGEIEEAARAGNYELPFGDVSSATTPRRIRDLSAVGATAKARRTLEQGNQRVESATFDRYSREFEAGLQRLWGGAMDLGVVSVNSEGVAADTDANFEIWVPLAHGGIVHGAVTLTNAAGTVAYLEDREAFDPGYQASAVKDFVVDYRQGRLRRLPGGEIGAGQQLVISYDYFWKQPAREQENEYAGRTAQPGHLGRQDYGG
jgi:hypothetical protein